jgi:Fe-S-cluster-containing hydrogenase component 2
MGKRIVIDLDACTACEECTAECSYLYHPGNVGVAWLREMAAYELTCRRCDEKPCVAACPNDALEQIEDGILKRHNLRCVGCQSCNMACPFGTLVPAEFLFRGAMCDFCRDRDVEIPDCVSSCPEHALTFEDPAPLPEMHMVGEHLAVRARKWAKKEVAQVIREART